MAFARSTCNPRSLRIVEVFLGGGFGTDLFALPNILFEFDVSQAGTLRRRWGMVILWRAFGDAVVSSFLIFG